MHWHLDLDTRCILSNCAHVHTLHTYKQPQLASWNERIVDVSTTAFIPFTGDCKSATGSWVLYDSDLATWSQIRLSDRVAVDLIEKMKTLGILGDTLLHTTNGKEYITMERLVDDIYECLEDQGGRVAIVDLPGALGVDFSHCNAQAQVLLQVSSHHASLCILYNTHVEINDKCCGKQGTASCVGVHHSQSGWAAAV